MLSRLFLGLIMILCFIMLYPFMAGLWLDNVSGFNRLMADGGYMSEIETSYWGLFPLLFFIAGVGGIAWLIVRDKNK